MPLSLRIPPAKENMIKMASKRAGKTKSAFILEAIDEKFGLVKNRQKTIRQLAGWLTHEEAEELRTSLDVFNPQISQSPPHIHCNLCNLRNLWIKK
jgi:uncharacterized protein (DUF1778 family)